jgi:hypothetical protein
VPPDYLTRNNLLEWDLNTNVKIDSSIIEYFKGEWANLSKITETVFKTALKSEVEKDRDLTVDKVDSIVDEIIKEIKEWDEPIVFNSET